MTDKLKRWAPTCNRFVAFIDIMGFRDRLSRDTHEDILELLLNFKARLSPIERDAASKMSRNQPKPQKTTQNDAFGTAIVRPLTFSDSILLVSGDNSPQSARFIMFNVQWVIQKALEVGIPIKGAIAYGKQTSDFDSSIHFGKPLVDAYELQNNLLLYGVVLHHTMERYLAENHLLAICQSIWLCSYATPFRTATATHYLVRFSDPDASIELLSKLYATVSGPTRLYVDNTALFAHWQKALDSANIPANQAAAKPTDLKLPPGTN